MKRDVLPQNTKRRVVARPGQERNEKGTEQVCPAKLDVRFIDLIGPLNALHVFRVCTQILAAAQYINRAAFRRGCRRMLCSIFPSCPADNTSCGLIGYAGKVGPHKSTCLRRWTQSRRWYKSVKSLYMTSA